MTKKVYRVRNWAEYNKGLVSRGSLYVWFDKKHIQSAEGSHGNKAYSDALILCALTLRQLFNLTYRATEGFLRSLIELHQLGIPTPDYSTLCRRAKALTVCLGAKSSKAPRHILIDSTGVQVLGEGEWKRLKHGESRCQVWKKLHIALDAGSLDIVALDVTDSVRLDGNYLPGLINQIKSPIEQITGDGAYDKKNCYETAYKRGAKPVFPPQHNAGVQRNKNKKNPALIPRDELINRLNSALDKEEELRVWKKENNYHRRSLAETNMSRLSFIFGDQMSARTPENQFTDLSIRCRIINKINRLGMPKSVAVF
jgi:IS5 family transposase